MHRRLLAALAASSLALLTLNPARADEYRVTGPVVHENLAIYLIHGKSGAGPVPLGAITDVNGTATDDKGGQYIFTYSNTMVFDSSAIFPASLTPYSFKGPDLFQLIGTTPGAPTYTVYIYFNARINADGSFTDLGTLASTDPNCDPI